jgi:prepilin-type N-terminal cleavage/methylation domain-containing protein
VQLQYQRGVTLIEMILVIGLLSLLTVFDFLKTQREFEDSMAKSTGAILYELNNAKRAWLANNPNPPDATYNGTYWLKHASCPGGLSSTEYLPCAFEIASTGSPIRFGRLSLSTDIRTVGAVPNQVTTATTTTSPFSMGGTRVRADLAGLAALTASAGSMYSTTPSLMATGGSFGSDPLTARITMVVSNNASNDAWLRTDGSNTMNSSLRFNNMIPSNLRQLENVSRIQNIATQALYFGRSGGAIAATPESIVVDADQRILGKLIVNNDKGGGNGVDVLTGHIRTLNGNISSSGSVTSGTTVQAGATVTAGTSISSGTSISAGTSLSAGTTITAGARLTTNEFLHIKGISVVGGSCTPNGLVSTSATGTLLSCVSGSWEAPGGSSSDVDMFSSSNMANGSFVSCRAGPKGKVFINATFNFRAPSGNANFYPVGQILNGSGVLLATSSTAVISLSTGNRYSSDSMPVSFLHSSLMPGNFYSYQLLGSAGEFEYVSYWCIGF